tara:strand:- start:90 stop:1895 length:1806 start_codon:yes stop_codon:yes gene_type:complete
VINQKILSEYNQFKNKHPIEHYSKDSSINLWWKCKNGHEWQQDLNLRLNKKNRGCTICRSLGFKFPDIAKEFHPKKNKNLSPFDITYASDKIVWWKCKNGHEWQKRVKDQIKIKTYSCASCNSLEFLFPEIAKEWHPTKNGKLKPSEFTYGSSRKVWWLCKNQHQYKTNINVRTRGSGCGKCSKATSLPEVRIYCELLKIFKEVDHRERYFGKEIDIFIKQYNIGIEYDGSYWHKNDSKDKAKNDFFKKKNITIIRCRENPLKKISNLDISCNSKEFKKENINLLLKNISSLLGSKHKVKISDYISLKNYQNEKKYFDIVSRLPLPEVEKSLAYQRPEIAAEWHPIKNLPLMPTMVNKSSTKNIWWICKNGHEWQYVVDERYKDGKKAGNCKVCESIGFNYPELAAQISDKNKISKLFKRRGQIQKFSEISITSSLKLYWECQNGHTFKREVRDAVETKNKYCVECKSLSFMTPHIAREWHPTKNVKIDPKKISNSSNKNVWWKCNNNHEWKAAIANRTRYPNSIKNKCKTCRSVGFKFPNLAKEWHLTKNKKTPFEVTYGSDEKVWWQCRVNSKHIWEASISHRTNKKQPTGCKYCAGRK